MLWTKPKIIAIEKLTDFTGDYFNLLLPQIHKQNILGKGKRQLAFLLQNCFVCLG